MNSLDRAKRFLAAKASKIALAAVPLAVLTVTAPSANAGFTMAINSQQPCNFIDGTGSCSTTIPSATGGDPLGNWIQLATVGLGHPDAFSGSFTLHAGGAATGTLSAGETIPVSWDFTISPTAGSGTANWTVSFALLGVAGHGTSASGQVPYGTQVSGTSTITIASAEANLSTWSVQLAVTAPNSNYTVDVPGANSLDLNPLVAAPEPASLALTAAGMLSAFFFRRRKR